MFQRLTKNRHGIMPDSSGRNPGWIKLSELGFGVVLALIAGAAAGYGRYWLGYFVLGQGTLVGLFIPWAAHILCPVPTCKSVKNFRPMIQVVILLFCFMAAQAIGFGIAQPWFEPLGWLGRIIQDGTRETVWGISLLGGAAAKKFQLGVSGGFWIFLNLFDLFFMFFFFLVGINSYWEAGND